MNRRVAIAATTTLALAAAMLGGCSGIRHNLTPEMENLSQRPDDVENTFALTCNEDWRMLVSDWQRAALIDRPVRLTPESIPH